MAKKLKNPMIDFDMKEYMSGGVMSSTGKNDDNNPKKKKVKNTKSPKAVTPQRVVKGAAQGCKPGYTRHTYVLSLKMIDQVKAVAHFFNCSEVAAAEQIIQKGLDEIQKKHGKKALTLQKTQSLFD